MAFSFEKYAKKMDPEFDGIKKVKTETLVGQKFVFEYVKFSEYTNDKGKTTEMVTAKVALENNEEVFFYTGSYKIVQTLKNIIESEGLIPRVPCTLRTYKTNNGMNGFEIADIVE